MVQRIKPVMLMSPISVAQFLPPGKVDFDLLVIYEASQMRPAEALGVIARAKQIVVVGDQKQLPPTSFFERLTEGDTDEQEQEEEEDSTPQGAGATEMESILSLCEARGLERKMLKWHYRSRDPSLIQMSNAEFYDDALILLPSPLQSNPDYGLKFRRVAGVYARGGSGLGRKGTNKEEALAIAKAVAAHARKSPDVSLGIVAFSKAQADMLTEILEWQRRKDPVLEYFLREGKAGDVFVKNIENVQGDERDVILISVGYGPQEPNGRLMRMNFGPINGEGGERRLNVMFSRARMRCEVFASFDPEDIDLTRTTKEGPRVFKRFLKFAQDRTTEQIRPGDGKADSDFEEDVAKQIRLLGYLADPQIGTGGFRIDLGVRHPDRPGRYLAAVECDGATYHSSLWARERDRHRQTILEGLGWRFHRIWSTDWFHNRAQEIQRLKTALETARASSGDGIRIKGANAKTPLPLVQQVPASPREITADLGRVHKAPPYVAAQLPTLSAASAQQVSPLALVAPILKVVEIEGPIHEDEIARRLSRALGGSGTGKRIAMATQQALALAIRKEQRLKKEGAFVMTAAQLENPPVRDRSLETGKSLRNAAYLPPVEILAAARQITDESGEMPHKEMIRAVAQLLGYRRVGSELSQRIGRVLRAKG